jgi:replication-associated recombination protein RarA
MADLFHPDELIQRLRFNKYRCFIITGRPLEGKTRLAQAMATRYDGQRLDLLALFAADNALSAGLDSFTPRMFKDYLKPYAAGQLVLVDEMEFLWHRWDDGEKRSFLTIVERWMKPAFLGFLLPDDPTLDGLIMPDQDGYPRVLSLHQLQAL